MTDRVTSSSDHQQPSQLTPRRIAALILAVLSVVFVLQNRDETTLVMFGVAVNAPLWLFTLTLLVIGIIVGALLTRRGPAR